MWLFSLNFITLLLTAIAGRRPLLVANFIINKKEMLKQKVFFESEDCPPASYYLQTSTTLCNDNEEEENDNDGQTPLNQRKNSSNESVISVVAEESDHQLQGRVKSIAEIGSKINKAEWWKAPEFIPRAKFVKNSQSFDDTNLSANVESPLVTGSVFDCGATVDMAQSLLFGPESSTTDSSASVAGYFDECMSTMPPIVNACNGFRQARLGVGPRPQPNGTATFVPMAPGGMSAPPPFPVWPQPHNPLATGVFPFRFAPPPLKSATANSVPAGYSANFTTFSAGLGPPIPAIVLKKKRKKKNRKSKDLSFIDLHQSNNDQTKSVQSDERKSSCSSTNHQSLNSRPQMDTRFSEGQSSSSQGNIATTVVDQVNGQNCEVEEAEEEDEEEEVEEQDVVKKCSELIDPSIAYSCPDLSEALRQQLLAAFSCPVEQRRAVENSANEKRQQQQQQQQQQPHCCLVENQSSQQSMDLHARNKNNNFSNDATKCSARQQLEEKTFFQHRPKKLSLQSSTRSNGSLPRNTVVQYQAGSVVTEVNGSNEDSVSSLLVKKLNRLIPRATYVEDEMADDDDDGDETNMFVNSVEADEAMQQSQTLYPYQPVPLNDIRHTVVLQRRHSMSDRLPPPYLTPKSRVCCALM
ncbi:hypothetical protein T4E_4532 [Trichinella pseudospiralis]|uniref:Uncharacterized protein n=2 Tax=Trichinella pseudospiralis TaxID=6337 RepID=A0A0V0YBE4_TRIPS|nr:hypothetical protein T4E_4532 [Trichinella pseudospiralis]